MTRNVPLVRRLMQYPLARRAMELRAAYAPPSPAALQSAYEHAIKAADELHAAQVKKAPEPVTWKNSGEKREVYGEASLLDYALSNEARRIAVDAGLRRLGVRKHATRAKVHAAVKEIFSDPREIVHPPREDYAYVSRMLRHKDNRPKLDVLSVHKSHFIRHMLFAYRKAKAELSAIHEQSKKLQQSGNQ